MYLNLASSYVWIEKNSLCADKGYIEIDLDQCRAASEEKGLGSIGGVDSEYRPKGCSLDSSKFFYQKDSVVFNHHSVGSREQNYAPICQSKFHRSLITTCKYDYIVLIRRL